VISSQLRSVPTSQVRVKPYRCSSLLLPLQQPSAAGHIIRGLRFFGSLLRRRVWREWLWVKLQARKLSRHTKMEGQDSLIAECYIPCAFYFLRTQHTQFSHTPRE